MGEGAFRREGMAGLGGGGLRIDGGAGRLGRRGLVGGGGLGLWG